jgi:ActR/RegA family two-component response regulator
MTGEGGIRCAVEAIQLSASDYLSKPFDLDELPHIFATRRHPRKKGIGIDYTVLNNRTTVCSP